MQPLELFRILNLDHWHNTGSGSDINDSQRESESPSNTMAASNHCAHRNAQLIEAQSLPQSQPSEDKITSAGTVHGLSRGWRSIVALLTSRPQLSQEIEVLQPLEPSRGKRTHLSRHRFCPSESGAYRNLNNAFFEILARAPSCACGHMG